MNKKYLLNLLAIIMVVFLSVGFVSCGSDDDDDIGDSTSSKAKVSLSLSGGGTTYNATVTVSGADASDVIVLGVRAEPQSSSGFKPAKYFEAGSKSTKGTCKITLEKGTTYFIYGYANIKGTRIDSNKQTKTVK